MSRIPDISRSFNLCFRADRLPQPLRAGDALDLKAYSLTFEENFDTLSVSAWGERKSRWIAHTPWNGDFGAASFSDPADGFPFTVAGASCASKPRKMRRVFGGGTAVSDQSAGRRFFTKVRLFRSPMKLPPGKGVWPAFWLIGLDRSAFTAEIDVLEYYGRAPYEFSSGYHIWRESHGGKNQSDGYWTSVPEGSLSSDFPTWGVEIGPKRTTIYFDRQPVWGFDTPPEFHMPFSRLSIWRWVRDGRSMRRPIPLSSLCRLCPCLPAQ